MKTVTTTGTFPNIEHVNSVMETATASTLRAAISRSIGKILKNPGLKSRRIKSVIFSVEVQSNKIEAQSNPV
jgi:hypothetical protein